MSDLIRLLGVEPKPRKSSISWTVSGAAEYVQSIEFNSKGKRWLGNFYHFTGAGEFNGHGWWITSTADVEQFFVIQCIT